MSDLQSIKTSRLLFPYLVVNWSVFAGKESQRDWNEQEVGYIYDAGTGILLIRASQFLSTIAWFFVCPVTRKWASREIIFCGKCTNSESASTPGWRWLKTMEILILSKFWRFASHFTKCSYCTFVQKSWFGALGPFLASSTLTFSNKWHPEHRMKGPSQKAC